MVQGDEISAARADYDASRWVESFVINQAFVVNAQAFEKLERGMPDERVARIAGIGNKQDCLPLGLQPGEEVLHVEVPGLFQTHLRYFPVAPVHVRIISHARGT